MDERIDYNSIPMQPTQTATEWLFNQLWDEPIDKFTWNAILSKAIKMEKDWLIHTYWVAYTEGRYNGDLTAEQYYNETFKK